MSTNIVAGGRSEEFHSSTLSLANQVPVYILSTTWKKYIVLKKKKNVLSEEQIWSLVLTPVPGGLEVQVNSPWVSNRQPSLPLFCIYIFICKCDIIRYFHFPDIFLTLLWSVMTAVIRTEQRERVREEVITEQRRRGGSGSRYDRFRQRFMSRPELIKVQQQMNTVEEHAEGKPYIIHPDPPSLQTPIFSSFFSLTLDPAPPSSVRFSVSFLIKKKKKNQPAVTFRSHTVRRSLG